jgi:phospholipase/carboxylesterase
MRARLILPLLLLASCSDCGHQAKPPERPRVLEKIRWPASAATNLKVELAATAVEHGDQDPSGETPPEGLPGVKVREHVLHGLYLIEVILGEAAFEDPLPMVVLLHGRGDRVRVPGGPFGGVPTPMRLILPQGPQRLGQGYTWLPVSITQNRPADLGQSLRERAGQLADLVRTLQSSHPTLGKPVVAGFSQGGMLTLTLALHHGDLFAAAFPLASWAPPMLWPGGGPNEEGPLPIRSLHGDADPIIPLGPTRDLFARLEAQGWDVFLQTFEGVGHIMSPAMNAVFEQWLEETLGRLAPDLTGGLGEAGPEPEAYAPYEPLDDETVRAIEEALEAAKAVNGEPADGGDETPDGGDEAQGGADGGDESAAARDDAVDEAPAAGL